MIINIMTRMSMTIITQWKKDDEFHGMDTYDEMTQSKL